jgi:hypothetical protein
VNIATEEDYNVEEIITQYEVNDGITSILNGRGYSENTIEIRDNLKNKGIMIFGAFQPFEFNLPLGPNNKMFLINNIKSAFLNDEENEKNP